MFPLEIVWFAEVIKNSPTSCLHGLVKFVSIHPTNNKLQNTISDFVQLKIEGRKTKKKQKVMIHRIVSHSGACIPHQIRKHIFICSNLTSQKQN